MIAPPFLVGAALLAWGYAGNSVVLAIVVGAIYELARFLGPRDMFLRGREPLVIRIALITVLALFIGAGVTQKFPNAIYMALRGLPLAIFPVAVLQVLAEGRRIPAGILRKDRQRASEGPAVEITHLFAATALIGAAATDPAARWFYPAAAILVAWAVLARAPRRGSAAVLLVAATVIGFGVHTGLSSLQSRLEDWSTDFLQELLSAGADPFKERTRIGEMGRIKLSDRIAMRAIPEGERPRQILLREAAFDTYISGEWRATYRTFTPRDATMGAWRLAPGDGSHVLSIRRSLPKSEGVLALPLGTTRVSSIPGAALGTLPSGAVRVRNMPSFVALRVEYQPDGDFAAAPTAADLDVPEVLHSALDQALAEGRVPTGAPREAEAAIRRFFAERYGYTLTLSDGHGGTRTLRDFLLKDRKGHCEYFATASVLLLRAAGIPARYVVGYSAQEYSPLEKAFIVRDRHAHAWATAWVDGRWIEVDNTPSRWADFEEQEARAWYGPALDLFSWAIDALRRNVFEAEWSLAGLGVAVVIVALLLALAWWARRLTWKRKTRPVEVHAATRAWQRVEATLAAKGLERSAHETIREFAARNESLAPGLTALARRYYVARFDPASGAGEAEALRSDVERWLARGSGRA
jgi:hypothetical protein